MEIVAGGTKYALAPLKLADVRDLGKAGVLKQLRRLAELDVWEQLDATAALIAASARRAGTQVQADDLLAAANGTELAAFVSAVPAILEASGFIGGGNPNEVSPKATTT